MIKLWCNCVENENPCRPQDITLWDCDLNTLNLRITYAEDGFNRSGFTRQYNLILNITEHVINYFDEKKIDVYGINFETPNIKMRHPKYSSWFGEYSYKDGFFIPVEYEKDGMYWRNPEFNKERLRLKRIEA